jgi:allantoinase
MPQAPGERVPYSAIVDRPKLTLPGNARLAIWVIVNVENWEIRRPMPRMVLPPPLGLPLSPDLPNWAWHEYGMRDHVDQHPPVSYRRSASDRVS